VHDAAILMSSRGIRHVPITEEGRVVSIISERDLFALQRLSLKALSASLRHAPDVDAVRVLAPRVRDFARHLLAQGLAARTLTALVSHLNDLLAQRLVELIAIRHGLDLNRACWLAFGSEGRAEQTIATDQDNGLALADEVDEHEHARWLAFGREVNQTLDACGYPLCKGGVMAGNEACCLRVSQWRARFERWIEQGAPEDLLNASIYFDLRPLAGNACLVEPLRELLAGRAAAVPRFLRQLAENTLRLRPALNWRGAIDTVSDGGREWIDLKMNGTAVFVDAARLFALAKGIDAVGTRERLTLAGEQLGVGEAEREGWASAFEVLQLMRLRIQVDAEGGDPGNPNRLDVKGLNEIDRHLLKESLRVARRVQQRVQLDWMR
jgi:CBS domain-containing protein